jgi:hypothetical protein
MTLQGEINARRRNSNAMGCEESANTMSPQRREEIERLTFYGRGGQGVMRLYQGGECDFGHQ